jgi:hypothetical protein
MKKILSILLVSTMVLTLAACNKNNDEELKYQDIKNIINKLEESSLKKEGIKIYLNQQYTIESHTDNDLEKVDYTYTYDGVGSFAIAYESADEYKGIEGLVDLFTTGTGYVGSTQKEVISYDYNELNKTTNETKKEQNNTDDYYAFTMILQNNECKLACDTKKIDKDKDIENKDTFYGEISQDKISNDATKNSLENIMGNMIIMDGYYNISSTNEYASSVLLKSKNLNNKDFNAFVEENKIKINLSDRLVFLDFQMNFKEKIKEEYGLDDVDNVIVKGSLGFNAETYELETFSYDLKDYFKTVLDEFDSKDEDETLTTKIDKYTVYSETISVDISAINFDEEFIKYTDSQEFLNDFINNGLPYQKALIE